MGGSFLGGKTEKVFRKKKKIQEKNVLKKKAFWGKKAFWWKKHFGKKRVLVEISVLVEKRFREKTLWWKKRFWEKSVLEEKAFLGKNVMVEKAFWGKKALWWKSGFGEKHFGEKSILGKKAFWWKKRFEKKVFLLIVNIFNQASFFSFQKSFLSDKSVYFYIFLKLFVLVSSSGHNVLSLIMCLMPLFFFYMLELNLGRDARILPSSCEYFPIESCSSLKACASRLVLAAN